MRFFFVFFVFLCMRKLPTIVGVNCILIIELLEILVRPKGIVGGFSFRNIRRR